MATKNICCASMNSRSRPSIAVVDLHVVTSRRAPGRRGGSRPPPRARRTGGGRWCPPGATGRRGRTRAPDPRRSRSARPPGTSRPRLSAGVGDALVVERVDRRASRRAMPCAREPALTIDRVPKPNFGPERRAGGCRGRARRAGAGAAEPPYATAISCMPRQIAEQSAGRRRARPAAASARRRRAAGSTWVVGCGSLADSDGSTSDPPPLNMMPSSRFEHIHVGIVGRDQHRPAAAGCARR